MFLVERSECIQPSLIYRREGSPQVFVGGYAGAYIENAFETVWY